MVELINDARRLGLFCFSLFFFCDAPMPKKFHDDHARRCGYQKREEESGDEFLSKNDTRL